jgi:hypothetical protein
MSTQNTKNTEKNYKLQVLEVNKNFKNSLRSTGKVIKILLASEILTPKQTTILKSLQSKGNEAKYTKFDNMVRRTKNNEITAFYVLQALYKYMK